jgi:hypothetical protein
MGEQKYRPTFCSNCAMQTKPEKLKEHDTSLFCEACYEELNLEDDGFEGEMTNVRKTKF